MAFAVFGPGILIVTRTDITAGPAINVGYAQELSIEIAGNTKQLYGQKQFPLVAARSTIKASGKFKAAEISGIAWNAFMYGGTFQTGGLTWNIDSTYTASTAAAPTVQVASSTNFEADLGITYSTSGLPLQRVSTGNEATGKYSVSATGLYTFAAGDASANLKITYTTTTTSGQSLVIANQNIGNTPTFQLDYYTSLNQPTAKPFAVRLYQSVAAKHMLGFKLEDFMIPEFDFDFFANASGNVLDYVFPDVS